MATTNTPRKDQGPQQSGGQGPNPTANRPQDQGMGDKARDVASQAADMGRDAASTVRDAASQAASAVSARAGDATHAAASGMRNLAGTIRENVPQGSMMSDAARSVASGLESGSRYLEQEGLGGMADDLSNFVRRNPVAALVAGIGIGFLLARSMSRS